MNTTATASPDGDLMSRHQVAVMFRVTSARIAQWRGAAGYAKSATRPGVPGTGAHRLRICSLSSSSRATR